MSSQSWRAAVLLLGGIVALSGCSGNTYSVRQVAYVRPAQPSPAETQIFVLRENSAMGSARKFAIVDNDTVMAVLTPGTFSHFTVPSGEHEIVAYVAGPLIHYRVMPAPGKTVYLYCKVGYTTGLFIEPVDEATAQSLMAEMKYTEIAVIGRKTPVNYKDHYDKLYK